MVMTIEDLNKDEQLKKDNKKKNKAFMLERIPTINILNNILFRLKKCDFKIYSNNGYLVLETNNKMFMVVV